MRTMSFVDFALFLGALTLTVLYSFEGFTGQGAESFGKRPLLRSEVAKLCHDGDVAGITAEVFFKMGRLAQANELWAHQLKLYAKASEVVGIEGDVCR